MEKRRLISLRSVLLQYLVRTALACLLVAVGWLLVLLLWIQNSGLFLPANQAAQACQKAAQDVLPGMTAETFDETQLDSLCRYALFAAPDSSLSVQSVSMRRLKAKLPVLRFFSR